MPPILYMALSSLPGDPDALYLDLQSSMNARAKAALADHYLSMFDWLKKRFQKKVWVERSGASLIFVAALVRLFPDSKFIHLHRDGRETAISIQRYPPLSLLAKSWRDAGRFGLDMLAPPFRLGDSRALAMMEKMASPFHRGAGALADLETAGAFWSSMVLTGLEALDSVPADRKLTVRYERLVAEPENQLTEILDFIDPEFSGADWIRSASGLIAPGANNSEALTPQEFCALTNACRPGLLALGYEA
ncbi:MAG: sulfotransferase [Parvularculaceae bacterium]